MVATRFVVLCTCPDREAATRIASALVEGRLAACVSITQPVTSVYRWQGLVESADEHLLLIKTAAAKYTEAEQAIVRLHPYQLPEIVALPIEGGLAGYLGWIDECTTTP